MREREGRREEGCYKYTCSRTSREGAGREGYVNLLPVLEDSGADSPHGPIVLNSVVLASRCYADTHWEL